jgi:hypothetical protein
VYIETLGPATIRLEVQAVIIIKTTEAKIVNLVFIIQKELGVKHINSTYFILDLQGNEWFKKSVQI